MAARRDAAPEHWERLTARVAELESERTRLSTMVAVLQQVASATHVADALLTVTHELGRAYDLDRSSIVLIDHGGGARIVASHEDPSIRSLSIELSRYPEVRRAIVSGATVHLPDVHEEQMSWMVRETLRRRNVGAAVVVPIIPNGRCVGALFLRTRRERAPIAASDIKFFESVAAILATALAKAHADSIAARQQAAIATSARRLDAQRAALIAFVDRLFVEFKELDGQAASYAASSADPEFNQMVGTVLQSLLKTSSVN